MSFQSYSESFYKVFEGVFVKPLTGKPLDLTKQRRFEDQVKSLNTSLDRYLYTLPAEVRAKVRRKVALDVLRKIVSPGYNPVDTGRSRAGWLPFLKAHGVDDGGTAGSETDQAAAAEGEAAGSYSEDNEAIIIVNGVGYTVFLEFGTATQPARGFVARAMSEVSAEIERAS